MARSSRVSQGVSRFDVIVAGDQEVDGGLLLQRKALMRA
jgi:hypothetical protein